MLDILIITETKLDDIFPVSQFHIDGYSKPYRLDRNRNESGSPYMSERIFLAKFSQSMFYLLILKRYYSIEF